MEITNPRKSFDISKKESESENNLVMFSPICKSTSRQPSPEKGPVYSTPRV